MEIIEQMNRLMNTVAQSKGYEDADSLIEHAKKIAKEDGFDSLESWVDHMENGKNNKKILWMGK